MITHPHVLLVEDDPADARLLLQAIDPRVQVERAVDLASGLAVLDDHRVDVVLLDLGLPGSQGLATLDRFLAAHPDVPVVVLTDRAEDDVAAAAIEAGAQEYVVKGTMGGEAVLRTLRHAVERHRLQCALDERAKELTGLYAVARELHVDQPIDALAEHLAEHVRAAVSRQDAMAEVARREGRLRQLVGQLPGILFTTDAELRVTSVGGSSITELGMSPDEVLGTHLGEITQDTDPDLGEFHAALAGSSTVTDRFWRERWWRLQVEPQRTDDGPVTGVVGLALDVTEARHREEELAATRARLRGLFDNATDAMILADDSGTYLDANPAACALTGHPHDELVGLHPWDLVAQDAEPHLARRMWDEFVAAGTMAGDLTLRRHDGTTVATEFRAVANIVPGVHLSVLRDVTARRQAQEALAESEARWRLMAEAATDTIYRVRTRPELVVDYLNTAIEAMSGFTVEQVRADPGLYHERVHPEDRGLLDPERLDPTGSTTVTVRFRRADGGWSWLEDSRSPIVEEGRTVGVQGVIRDVTRRELTNRALRDALEAERAAAERLRSADQVKSHFLQAVSHELRTPLTAVLGLGKTLVTMGDQLSDDERSHLLRRVVANADRLDVLLSDLLDLEQLEHGTIRLERRRLDLHELVRHVAAETDLGERTLQIGDEPVFGDVDRARTERILHNLLSNAAKHTPPGTTIRVRCRRDRDAVVLEVTDDGPGVPDELAVAIFEPFRQGPQAYDRASPGTGIGLSIVRQFALLHGGTAWVQSGPQGGASFVVRLPDAARPVAGTAPSADQRGGQPAPPVPQPSSLRAAETVGTTARRLLRAATAEEVADLVQTAVRGLGGTVVAAREADDVGVLPLDIAFGLSEARLAAADAGTTARMLLDRLLPGLVADARRALAAIDRGLRLTDHPAVDPLTGLPTSRPLPDADAVRVDLVLDELGAVHDQHGAAAVDAVVRAFAHCLREELRAQDPTSRPDPARFVMLLHDADTAGARRLVARVRTRWESDRPLPVSFTFAISTGDHQDPGAIVADAAAAVLADPATVAPGR